MVMDNRPAPRWRRRVWAGVAAVASFAGVAVVGRFRTWYVPVPATAMKNATRCGYASVND
jgi:hypothetical protein